MTTPRHIVFDRTTTKPAPHRGVFPEVWRWLCTGFLKASGWTIEGDWPDVPKAVLIAAPHTSNWDGFNMLAAAGYYRIKLHWMGKQELIDGPFGWYLKRIGCIPVDRAQSNDRVRQMADMFGRTNAMVLAVPPEATRAKTRRWKTGFYYIAHAAGIPIVFSVLDYGSKTIRVSGMVVPCGDYDADFALIKTHDDGAKGRLSERFYSGTSTAVGARRWGRLPYPTHS